MLSKVRMASGVVIALFALAVAFELPRSLFTEYGGFGSGPRDNVLGFVPLVVVTAPLVWLGIWMTFRRGLWALIAGVVLSVVATVTGGLLGEAANDRAKEAIATACTPDERAEFVALEVVPTNGEYGRGNSDGSCQAAIGGRTQSSLDDLRRRLEGRGWKPDGTETYVREGKRLLIVVTPEGDKGLDITLRFLGDDISR